MEDEIWKNIPGFGGMYEASSIGRIRAVDRVVKLKNGQRRIKGKLLSISLGGNGYPMTNLSKNSKQTTITVHRAVLSAFTGEEKKGFDVRHKNGIKTDCVIENLEWGTRKENENDKRLHGKLLLGERHPNAILTTELVKEIRFMHDYGGIRQCEIARNFDIDPGLVWSVVKKANWKHVE